MGFGVVTFQKPTSFMVIFNLGVAPGAPPAISGMMTFTDRASGAQRRKVTLSSGRTSTDL